MLEIIGPLPGFATAPPQGVTLPGLTPAGQTPPLPGLGAVDPALSGPQATLNQTTPDNLTGSLQNLTKEEQDYVEERLNQGDDVEIVPTGTVRKPDFKISGKLTEYKFVSGVRNQTEDGLSAAISNRILNARGQSGNIVIDARQQPGMTRAAAERAIARAISNDDRSNSKILEVDILTTSGTVTYRR